MDIHYVIYAEHLVSDETPEEELRDYAERYAGAVHAALEEEFSDAAIEVEVKYGVSGVGSGVRSDHSPDVELFIEDVAMGVWDLQEF